MDKTKCVAALFDFDGVVMDTESQYSIFWNEVGKKYHPEYEEFGKIIKGQTLRQIYDRYFQGMEHEQAEITEGLNRFETEMRYEYVPGVAEFMQSLRAHGVKIAIVTSSNEKKYFQLDSDIPRHTSDLRKIATQNTIFKSIRCSTWLIMFSSLRVKGVGTHITA